jgi:hypothetical protein
LLFCFEVRALSGSLVSSIFAGWIRFRASLMAMRRTSWIDQRINDGVAMLWFLPWFGVSFF